MSEMTYIEALAVQAAQAVQAAANFKTAVTMPNPKGDYLQLVVVQTTDTLDGGIYLLKLDGFGSVLSASSHVNGDELQKEIESLDPRWQILDWEAKLEDYLGF
jgi:hypothetical protein